ncbi:hypothetical protein B0H11DRAFT_2051554 [Mycena galericulata]|nr:hypothetical protein B0H11DRAFT_2051554 [Mycena galericulata]
MPLLDMATTVEISFEGLSQKYTATNWSLPKHEEPFEPLLTDVISVPHSLLINRGGDRIPKKVTFEQARRWGYEEGHCAVIYAQAQSVDGSTKFCLRFILNTEESTRDRQSMTFQSYVRLLKDAKFHSRHLVKAEGVFVPRHYGIWLMDTGDWAGKVVCSITQWCGNPWNELSRTDMNTQKNRILVGRTLEILHDFHVTHGGVVYPPDFRHVILDVEAPGLSREDLLNGKAPCYIVDFSEARARHACARRLPVLPLDAYVYAQEMGCAELAKVTYRLGFMKQTRRLAPECETYKALEWYSQYSKRFPHLKRSDLRLAQRAKLYADMPRLYPEVHVWFEGPEEKMMIQMIIPDSDCDEETVLSADSAVESRAESMSPETVSDPLDVAVDKLRLTESEDRVVALT